MTQPAILVENLGKRYQIGLRRAASRTLRETLVDWAKAPWRRLRTLSGTHVDSSSFWAIRNLHFEVQPGEVLGVIGRNGAGKSTLLKLLSRISEPTEGRAVIRGRVASLLEVGTGFHHELTGRENIFLNGAILGMPRSQIFRKFHEIVAFSGVEQFLDTPIKRYSSGMKVRLAFSVAAHLEPQILMIDEVLAVGDHEFQQRCLGKMQSVAASGRTVLFVSHNIAAIQALCTRAMLLTHGKLDCQGTTAHVLDVYMRKLRNDPARAVELASLQRMKSDCRKLMTVGRIVNALGASISQIAAGDPLIIEVEYEADGVPFKPVLGVVLKTALGTALFGIDNRIQSEYLPQQSSSGGTIQIHFDSLPLCPGQYSIDLYLGDELQSLDSIESAFSLEVTASNYYGSGKLPSSVCGPLLLRASWSVRESIRSRPLA
jgi:lipopolysaccharide transport system ATP-binding protein